MNDHKSTELKDLFTALVLAQAEFKVASKNAFNPHFKSNYSNLESLIEASRPALTKHGLSVMQPIVHEDGQDFLFSMLCHVSGQWMSTKMRLVPQKSDVQALGAYITYIRRYSYASLLGICDGLDDDGEMDMDHNKVQETKAPIQKKITAEQLRVINSMDEDYKEAIKKTYKIKYLTHLYESEAEMVISKFAVASPVYIDTI